MKIKHKILTIISASLLFNMVVYSGYGQNNPSNDPVETKEAASDDSDSSAKDKVYMGYDIALSKEEVSSSVGVITSDDLSKFSAINPANALFGQAAGLTVLQNGGDWWSQSPSITIRGLSSLMNNSPLILVDGFERDMRSLSLNEIENISVLKDAAAMAIYGQRGANGVIQITTKRGANKTLNVDVSYERGVNQAFRLPTMLNAYGYANAVNEALILDGKEHRYSNAELEAYKTGQFPSEFPNVDWFGEALRNSGFTQEMNATFSGGTDDTKYFVLLNYLDGEGILNADDADKSYSTQLDYNKINFRTNLDISITKSTNLKLNLAGKVDNSNRPGRTSNAIFSALYSTPSAAFPIKHDNGTWGGTSFYEDRNPVAMINARGFAKSQNRTLYTDATLTQDLSIITPGLSASLSVAYDNSITYWDSKTRNFEYEAHYASIDEVNSVLYGESVKTGGEDTELNFVTSTGDQWRKTNAVFRLNYDTTWGKNKLNAVAFFHQDGFVGNGQYTTFHRQNFASLIHYVNDNKFSADLALSYSGNNILPDDNRFAFYPALSLGWMAINKGANSNSGLIDMLKLRVSGGLSGNELNHNKDYQNLHDQKFYSGHGYYFEDGNKSSGGIYEAALQNTDIKPETALITNIGADATLFGNLDITVDAFYERRSNILVSQSGIISGVLGVSPSYACDGIVENRGVEATLNWRKQIGDFKYNVGGQFSFNRNKIIEMNEISLPYSYLERTGKPIGQTFGYENTGFFNSESEIATNDIFYTFEQDLKPGDVKYKDQNNDGKIDEFDAVAMGYNTIMPEIYYSFTLGAEYKGFGFNALFQGVENINTILTTPGVFIPLVGNSSISTFSNDRWTPATSQTATLPRLSVDVNRNNQKLNNVWLRDGAYLKLRTLEIYYHIPKTVLSAVKMKRGKLFFRGMNLFSLDDIKVMDPEAMGTLYPTLKSFNFGVNIGF